jgi:predicted enzyme related to lactoylglutathione lyase
VSAGSAVAWFDIPARDIARAIRFYSAILGAEVRRQDFSDTSVGILPHGEGAVGGCVFTSPDARPGVDGPLLYLDAQGRLDQALAAVVPNGGQLLQPKHSIGDHGWRAIILDSEGNRIALHSR